MSETPFTLDLTAVMRRARKDPTVTDWDDTRFAAAELEYRRFLALCVENPDQKISAPPDVDVVWHTHILDTPRYAADCEAVFGRFLHHDVCDGEEADVISLDRTLALYAETFGEEPSGTWRAAATCANPGDGCGSIRQDSQLAA